MITFLEGKIVEKQPTRVVLAVGGVGYEVRIPLSSFDDLPHKNEVCLLLTHDYVREDQRTLYGFCTEAERKMFTMLLSISGVGPKLALSALSGLSVRELHASIADGDADRLSSVPGVGKKTAQRIVVELRDRISDGEAMEAIAGDEGLSERDTVARDAILALVSLGYKQPAARKMVQSAVVSDGPLEDVEDIVRKALAR